MRPIFCSACGQQLNAAGLHPRPCGTKAAPVAVAPNLTRNYAEGVAAERARVLGLIDAMKALYRRRGWSMDDIDVDTLHHAVADGKEPKEDTVSTDKETP